MWIAFITVIYLAILGIKDWIDRKIPICGLAVGAVLLPGMGIYRCVQGELMWWEMLVGVLPGALLLLVAWLSGKAGYADGIVMTELGLCLGYRESMLLFCFSLLLTAMISILLLFLRKVRKDTKMPYLAFLAIVFLMLRVG